AALAPARAARLARAAAAPAALAILALGAADAHAATTLTAAPNPVSASALVTIRGRGWPVIEFCQRRVTLTLRSAQNSVAIGTVGVGAGGGFRRAWRPSSRHAGAGAWKVVATMRCESGDDGSPVPVVRTVALRIR
ncbi:hypothetical protein Q5424_25540, partial [Conexibacter sp. JD483]|uniref:hypothetical protein n=2 Tax=Conexibacter TaxID=191494 RepID=UPI00286FDCDF